MNFFIPCIPPKATAQQQKTAVIGGKVRKYDPANVKQAKQGLLTLLLQHQPDEPFAGPIKLEVEWHYPLRKSETKARRQLAAFKPLPCFTRPDCDNLLKAFCDQLTTARFMNDDAQIADVHFRKFWSQTPGIKVTITNISE